jgi:hypothetical protein
MRAFIWFAAAVAVAANAPLANSSPLYNTETYSVPAESPLALRPTLSAVEPVAPSSIFSAGFTSAEPARPSPAHCRKPGARARAAGCGPAI